MQITIRQFEITSHDGLRNFLVTRGYLPGGQLLIEGPMTEGRDLTAKAVAIAAVCGWIRDNRPNFTVEVAE